MTIDIPDGYTPPEEVKDGHPFKQLVTFKKDGDKLIVCALGDMELDDDDYVSAVKKGLKNMRNNQQEEQDE